MRNPALHLAVAGALSVCAAFETHAQWGIRQNQSQSQTQSQAQSQAQSATPHQPRRGARISARSPRRNCSPAIARGPVVTRVRRASARTGDSPSLAGFLREHYTNSRESAAALAAYLVGVPGDARAARPDAKPPRAARTDDAAKPAEQAKPAPAAAKPPAQPRGRQTVAAPPPPEPAPVVEPAPVAPAPPPEPPKPQWDIFD